MIDDLWSLPGPRRLLLEIADGLSTGRSVVLVRPAATPLPGLLAALRSHVDRDWVTVKGSELTDGSGTLVQRLHRHLGLPGEALAATASSVADALDGRAIWLEPPGVDDARALSELVVEVADRTARRGSGPVLCVCTTSEQLTPLPTPDTGLIVAWWWGRTGPLDTRVVVDAAMPLPRVLGDVDAVAEVAAFALDIADQLARGWNGAPAVDLRAITGAEELTASRDAISAEIDVSTAPPRLLKPAWDAGHIDWWGDHVAIHPACLLNDPTALASRVWRGHLSSVLPFVELRRQVLARWVSQRHGTLVPPVDESVLADLECGPLLHLIRTQRNLRATRSALDLALALRDARNALAHLEPLPRDWLAANETLLRTRSIM